MIRFKTPSGWSRFNASIAACESGYRMLVRSSNYTVQRMRYTIHEDATDAPRGVIDTRWYLLSLDEQLEVTRIQAVEDRTDPVVKFPSGIRGFEDCRLFEHASSWYAVATTREHDPSGVARMALLRVDEDAFHDLRLLEGPQPGRHEKNWMPMATAELFFIYSCRPTVVLRYEPAGAKVVAAATRPGPVIAEAFRGGSQAVPLRQGFLCAVHESIGFEDGNRVYLHRFVLMDKRLRLARISPQFYFVEREVEFCAGLALKGNRLVASLGVGDREAYLVSMELGEVLAALQPVCE